MPVSETLQSPLVHVQQQFSQNCCFTFDGNTYRATSQLVCTADFYLRQSKPLVVQDYFDVVKVVESSQLQEFISKAQAQLDYATAQYTHDYARAKDQFRKLVTPVESVDEKAD